MHSALVLVLLDGLAKVQAKCKQKALSHNLSAHAPEHGRVDEGGGHLDPPMPLQMRTCLPHALARWEVGLWGAGSAYLEFICDPVMPI